MYMKKIQYLLFTMPLIPLTAKLCYWCMRQLSGEAVPAESGYRRICLIVGVLTWMFALVEGSMRDPESWSRKEKFDHPKPPEKLLRKRPQGIILGKYRNRYVCDTGRPAHVLVLGQSGSGKSVLLLSTLLVNAGRKKSGDEREGGEFGQRSLFVLDLKGELSYKSIRYSDENGCIVSINDRSLMGYDMLYKLHRGRKPTTQEIITTMNQIILYLVPKSPNDKQPYFVDAARNLGNGLSIAYVQDALSRGQNPEMIDIIDRILGEPVEQQILHVLETARPTSAEYKYLNQFSGMIKEAGNATLGSVYSSLCNGLTVFANDQDLRYMLKVNPRRVSPDTLHQERRSVYLTLDESKLEQYSSLTRIILAQMLDAAMELPDSSKDNGRGCLFVLDEISRVLNGSSDMAKLLTSSIKTLRSKGVILYIINQTISAFEESVGSKAGVDDLVSNCEYTIILSAKDRATAQWIEKMGGQFLQRQMSSTGSYAARKYTTSYQLQALYTADELLRLQSEGKELLISPYGIFRLKRVAYYEDNRLNALSEEIQADNDNWKKLMG